ncbi:Hsp33 family molecular chaperone HslO [Neisseriaceae bacterium ESL0693]|nr:Hsp33 family molecular chaperone HslO [Neisseriaceae bacterium ESL0693]
METISGNHHDQLTRFVFDQCPVRGLHVNLTQVWQHIVDRKTYPVAIRHALGELTAAAVLLASNLKFEGSLIVQVQGQGILKMLVAEATSAGTCRATARWNEEADLDAHMSLTELLGEGGVFVMTLQPLQGEAWQGIVELTGDSIARMLMNYMAQSEQLDTHIELASDEHHAAGLLLQRLPSQDIEPNDWQTLTALTETLSSEELNQLDAATVLYRLFHEQPVRVFEPRRIEFACSCSRGKVSDMLLLLGAKEVGEAVAEEGSIEVNCDFCHERYVFDDTDVNTLFGQDVVKLAKETATEEIRNH